MTPSPPLQLANNRSTATPPSRTKIGLAFAAIYLIWGSTYLGIRVAVETVPPFLLGGARFAVAGGALCLVRFSQGVSPPSGRAWLRASIAGISMIAVGNGLVTYAEVHVPSNLAALLIATVPVMVALMDWARPGGTRPRGAALLGIGLGALGMLLLVAPGARHADQGRLVGVLAVLVAAAGWAGGSLYSRYCSPGGDGLLSAALQMLTGGGSLLLISALRGELGALDPTTLSSRSLVAFAYLTLFGSIVAFSAFTWLLRVTSPTRVSTTAYVNPVVAVILGWLVLGETLPPASLAGAGFILVAVVLMVRVPSRAERRS